MDPQFVLKVGNFSCLCLCGGGSPEADRDGQLTVDRPRQEAYATTEYYPCSTEVASKSQRLVSRPRADGERILMKDFMSGFFSLMWPKIASAASVFMQEKLADALESMPAAMQGEVENTVSFGDVAPEILEVYSYKQKDCLDDGMEVCGRMRWDANVDCRLAVGPLGCGICRIQVEGDGCVELRPLLDALPVLGGFHIYFFDPPKLKVEFTGVASLGNIIGKVQQLVDDAFGSMMVLPRRLTDAFSGTKLVDIPHFRNPPPVGILRVHIIAAYDLIAADFNVLSPRTSDPYCILKLGLCEKRTRTINGTCFPEWGDVLDLVVHHERQHLALNVMDEDLGADEPLGEAALSVAELLAKQQTAGRQNYFWLPLDLAKAAADGKSHESTVQLRLEYFSLEGQGLPHPYEDMSNMVGLIIKLYHTEGIASDQVRNTQIRIRTGEEEVISKKCRVLSPAGGRGFGKQMSRKMLRLVDAGVEPAQVAEAFDVPEESVLELHRQTNGNPTWFGWDQALYMVVADPRDAHLQLDMCLPGKWNKAARWMSIGGGEGTCLLQSCMDGRARNWSVPELGSEAFVKMKIEVRNTGCGM